MLRLTSVCLLILASTTFGHDLWLIPHPKITLGKVSHIQANSGMDFPVSESAPDTSLFTKRVLVSPDGKELILDADGKEGTSGLMKFTPEKEGIYIGAVTTRKRIITLSAERFNAYLVSDGMPHIYLERVKEKTLDKEGVEQYSKSPKVLFRVGNGKTGDPCKEIGLPLEIIPTKNPFTLKVGDTLPVKVLFQGKPLANAPLGWDHPGDGEPPSGTVRTNEKGEALIPLAKTGLMTIRLTHMTRPKKADHEWESFWTTLSFELKE